MLLDFYRSTATRCSFGDGAESVCRETEDHEVTIFRIIKQETC